MIDSLMSDASLWDATLVQAALRTLALTVLVGAGLALFRVRNPHHQLAAWTAVLAVALVMPLLMQGMVIVVPTEVAARTVTIVEFAAPPAAFAEAAMLPPAGASPSGAGGGFAWRWLVLGVYFAVAGVMLLRLGVGLVLTARLRARARRIAASWTQGADVRVTEELTAPVTAGATVLLPADFENWAPEKRHAVLLHERSHAARGDFYVQVLAALHRAVFWFSPAAWWLHEKLTELAEHASDAEAAARFSYRADYAAVLLDFAQAPPTRSRLAPIAVGMARPAAMRQRIERVLADKHGALARAGRGARAAIGACVVAGGLAAAISIVETPAQAAAEIEVDLPGVRASAAATKEGVAEARAESASGPATRETREVGSFDAVSFGGAGHVIITVGPKASLVLEGDAETLARTKAEVSGGMLSIGRRDDDFGRGGRLTAHITVPRLASAQVSGSGQLKVSGLNGGETAIALSGSGRIEADGKLDAVNLVISGSGLADMPKLVVTDANVVISGSGSALVDARGALNVKVSGSGVVRYIGAPKDINTSISGSGSVRRRDEA